MLVMNALQRDIFQHRYGFSPTEDWSGLSKRVGRNIGQAESDPVWIDRFTQVIEDGDFMPGGRILFGAGRRNFNMLNCYRLHPEDTVQSISDCIKNTYLISCGGGGIGFNFSSIRPLGDDIQNIKHSAPGSVSNMRMINEIGEHVRAGKNRRTALIAILNVTHPDLLEFLHVKLDLEQLKNFNISVGITNRFLDAVKNNEAWTFEFNGRHYHQYAIRRQSGENVETVYVVGMNPEDAIGRAKQHFRVTQDDIFSDAVIEPLLARTIWNKIIESSWKCGDPGIYNLDMANTYTNVSYFEDLSSPNPCGEIPLPPYGNCCLGHVNLNHMFDAKKKDVDWKKLAYTIRLGVRFLDDVLTVNSYPIPECKTVGERSRRIGLGVTGLHYLLIKLGYKYGDQKCLEFLERLFSTFRNEAYLASVELAQEKGAFPMFDVEKYCDSPFVKQMPPRLQKAIRTHGIRNAVMLTIAPCGTNSMVLGVSSGIEPIFATVYERSYREGNVWRKELVADRLFAEFYAAGLDTSVFVGSHEIGVEQHIAVQATIQKYIDSSISKTTNIPEHYPVEDLSDVILEYAAYVKGFTIYRTNSRGLEPLKPVTVTDEVLRDIASKALLNSDSTEACRSGVCEI
jgi:ribonucleoside-diphosphate reductase alpha chain